MSVIDHIISFVFPPLCRHCKSFISNDSILCQSCLDAIKPIVSKRFPINHDVVLTVFSISSYDYPIRSLITAKFRYDSLAASDLALLVTRYTPIATIPIDTIIPVPLHWTRYAWRGYNQAHIMASRIGRECKAPVVSLVRRRRRTAFQWKLSAQLRKKNVQDAFSFSFWHGSKRAQVVTGKHILLVDDLCTTGATLVAIAKLLVPLKPASISAITGCRAV